MASGVDWARIASKASSSLASDKAAPVDEVSRCWPRPSAIRAFRPLKSLAWPVPWKNVLSNVRDIDLANLAYCRALALTLLAFTRRMKLSISTSPPRMATPKNRLVSVPQLFVYISLTQSWGTDTKRFFVVKNNCGKVEIDNFI